MSGINVPKEMGNIQTSPLLVRPYFIIFEDGMRPGSHVNEGFMFQHNRSNNGL